MVAESNAVLIKVGNSREIALKPETVLGRQAECDVLLTEGHASRRHAKVLLAEGSYWLEDLGSSNGTFLNGKRITGRVRIASGDRLRFDVEEFDFRIHSQAPVARTLPTVAREEATAYRAPESAAVVAESSGVFKRPGAWADPDALGDGGVNKTQFIDPAQMKQMASASPILANPSAVDGPHLQVVSGSRAGLNIRLAVGDSGNAEWTIGSQADREVQFMDSGVSALHAKIVNEGERWKVLDQMSANGTFVNGKRANVSYLASGDRVRFGPVECVFHTDGSGAARITASQRMLDPGLGEGEETKGRSLVVATIAFLATIAVLFVVYKFLLSK
ncbi:FHA domain-containing protein [Steroidobacter sp. S1-65]|uniref:FHA domain-containing protein n=1 Tax=Steroidobacter gossypii TaxID=2805490 RepID=A0ABS1WWH3_9GAMM|nr:FHA domain-containing protein [Steroidobacter gossypii]MBM0105335.1 FHA domain-containing protein [Steroidobacter gossypii]